MENIRYQVQNYMKRNDYNYMPIFTDESKDPGSGYGTGTYLSLMGSYVQYIRINDRLSVCTAEIVAIILGLRWVEDVRLRELSFVQTLCIS